MKSNARPYINAEIFLDCIRTVCTEAIPVLLTDDCSSLIASDVIGLLSESRVCEITVTPPTTQLFQVLDVTLFGALKRNLRYQLPFGDEKATVNSLSKDIKTSNKQWWNLTCGALLRHWTLSLAPELSQIGFSVNEKKHWKRGILANKPRM
jgi:hypothetical protein